MADHVVPQVIETKLIVGAVCNVRRISSLLIAMVHLRQNHSNTNTKELVYPPHPFCIPLGEIIVDRNEVNAVACQCIEIYGQSRHQCLTFACSHFGNSAVMQYHASDQLHIEMTHVQNTFAGLAHDREGFRQKSIEGGAGRDALFELFGLCPQLGIGKWRGFAFQRVDCYDRLEILFDQPIVTASEDFL